jgi:hypothetical protein
MKRVLVLVAAVGLILPAAGQAATFSGVVIAKSAKRHALVTASNNGTVRTVRAPKAFRKIGLGAIVSVRAAKLPDGTFAAQGVKKIGLGKKARVRGSVAKRSQRTLYLSAGNSVFTLSLRSGAGSQLRVGDKVSATATVGRAQIFCDHVTPIGHDDQIELEGIYLSTEGGVLSLAVHHKGLVKVIVPDSYVLPDLTAGDEISLTATVASDGTLTLESIDNEDAVDGSGSSGNDGGVDMGDNWFTVAGILDSVSGDSVSVDVEGHDQPVQCSVPADVDVSDFTEGDAVEMTCQFVDGDFVLVSLTNSADDGSDPGTDGDPGSGDPGTGDPAPPPPPADLAVEGVLQSIRADGVGVQVFGHTDLVNCAMPAGTNMSGFVLGDRVDMDCHFHDGRWNLASLSGDHAQLTLEP